MVATDFSWHTVCVYIYIYTHTHTPFLTLQSTVFSKMFKAEHENIAINLEPLFCLNLNNLSEQVVENNLI